MSELAWSYSPKFERKHKQQPVLTAVPEKFKTFLQNKIAPLPAVDDHERDHVIRRALALYRLCWMNVPNGWQLVDERLQEVLGENWQESFKERTGEKIAMPELSECQN